MVVPDPCEIDEDVWAAGLWRGRLRSAVLAWKLGQVNHLDPLFAWHIAASVVSLDPPDTFALVPVPTTWRSRRERGRNLVSDVCRAAGELLETQGFAVQIQQAVRLARQTKDQSALTARERAANVRGAMALRLKPDVPVVMMDDIITTGSTLNEMKRVLVRGGVEVIGGVSIAAVMPVRGDFSR